MKKKLLLFLTLVAVMTCIFAISALAAEIPDWTDITTVDGMSDKSVFGADGTKGATSRVLMSDGITYPAYYICKDSKTFAISYTDLNAKTGKSYEAANVVRIEIPKGTVTVSDALKQMNGYTALLTVVIPEGATTISQYGFKTPNNTTNSPIISITIPSTITSIGSQAFYGCNSLKELIIPEGVTEIPKEMAYYTTALEKLVIPSTITKINASAFRSSAFSNELVIPEGCTYIDEYAFKASGVTKVTLPSTLETVKKEAFKECPALTDVYSKSPVIGSYMFQECIELKNITLENTVVISERAFNNAKGSKVETLVLPEGLTTIGAYAFPRLSITELVLPSTLVNVSNNEFRECKKLQKVVVLGSIISANMFAECSSVNKLVITENIQTMGTNAFGNVSKTNFTICYTGTDYERIQPFKSITDRFDTSKCTYCSYEDYLSGNYTAKSYLAIYDINLCVAAFDGVHTEPQDDGDCTTAVTCSMCKEHTFKEALQHTIGEKITYTSFLEVGEYYNGCTNDGCTVGTTEETKALFAFLGYSVAEFGNGGMAICFSVDKEAVAKYEQATGDTVKYGLFAASQKKLGAADMFDSNGNAADGVINADVTAFELDIFELKITGLTDENKGARLAIGAYVAVTGEGGMEYSYLQSSAPASGEKYYFVSYNDVLGILK